MWEPILQQKHMHICQFQILTFFLYLVPRPHLAFESRLVTGPSHEFGQVTCPDAPKLPTNPTDVIMGKKREEAELLYPRRVGRLRIFPAAKTDEVFLISPIIPLLP